MVKEHLSGYQARDYEVVDYEMYKLPGTELFFRGPEQPDLKPQQYFVCLGAAQTFGCFCENPFPKILQEQLDLPALNLGYGGAGPRFYLRHTELLEYLNNAQFVIVQVMSGRSEDNSLFESQGLEFLKRRSDGLRLSSDDAYKSLLENNYLWKKSPVFQSHARTLCRVVGALRAVRVVFETRRNWLNSYEHLLNNITSPKILFWFSQRTPEYRIRYTNLGSLFSSFPQLVNQEMVNKIRTFSDYYVECKSSRGSPQRLTSRFTGEPVQVRLANDRPDFGDTVWRHNRYYPSPEMHIDAAQKLEPICKELVGMNLQE